MRATQSSLLYTSSRSSASLSTSEILRLVFTDAGFQIPMKLNYFQLTYPFRPHYGSRVNSVSNRNEYHEFSGGKGRPARNANNLSANREAIV
jgi:hypothetical protein